MKQLTYIRYGIIEEINLIQMYKSVYNIIPKLSDLSNDLLFNLILTNITSNENRIRVDDDFNELIEKNIIIRNGKYCYLNSDFFLKDDYQYIDEDEMNYINIFSDFYNVIPKLSYMAKNIFFNYILVNSKIKKNIIYLKYENIINYLKISDEDCDNGIEDLINNNVIIYSNKDFYYINLNFFSRGIILYKEDINSKKRFYKITKDINSDINISSITCMKKYKIDYFDQLDSIELYNECMELIEKTRPRYYV